MYYGIPHYILCNHPVCVRYNAIFMLRAIGLQHALLKAADIAMKNILGETLLRTITTIIPLCPRPTPQPPQLRNKLSQINWERQINSLRNFTRRYVLTSSKPTPNIRSTRSSGQRFLRENWFFFTKFEAAYLSSGLA